MTKFIEYLFWYFYSFHRNHTKIGSPYHNTIREYFGWWWEWCIVIGLIYGIWLRPYFSNYKLALTLIAISFIYITIKFYFLFIYKKRYLTQIDESLHRFSLLKVNIFKCLPTIAFIGALFSGYLKNKYGL